MTDTKPSETIVVVLEGGLVRAVCAADGVPMPSVVIVDYDVEGGDADRIHTTVHGDEAYVQSAWSTRDTALVDWVDEWYMNDDDDDLIDEPIPGAIV